MLIVGIDPGYEGAIAFLRPGEGVVSVHDMPTAPNASGKTEIDELEILNLLTPERDERLISMLEKVATMPKQGISSAFRFGEGVGVVRTALTGHGWEKLSATPAQWKRHFSLNDSKLTQPEKKKQSIAKAKALFPHMAHMLTRVSKDDGRAEAMLIARYCYDTMNQHDKEAA